MNYLFLITGILIGIFIGLVIGMFSMLLSIDEGVIKDFYHIPFKPCDRDLYAIKDGQLERIMTLPEMKKQKEVDNETN